MVRSFVLANRPRPMAIGSTLEMLRCHRVGEVAPHPISSTGSGLTASPPAGVIPVYPCRAIGTSPSICETGTQAKGLGHPRLQESSHSKAIACVFCVIPNS